MCTNSHDLDAEPGAGMILGLIGLALEGENTRTVSLGAFNIQSAIR